MGRVYSEADLVSAYQTSKACIIPFTGGSARHPVTTAMANAAPVIATAAADIPEYLGPPEFMWMDPGNRLQMPSARSSRERLMGQGWGSN